MLETLVHVGSEKLLRWYVCYEVTFDEALVMKIDPGALPKTWAQSPSPPSLQKIGDDWVVQGASAVLRVPSAVVQGECNYLLNPAHPDFRRIAVGPRIPVRFDPRLIKVQRQ
jgi:RES domain-containing protein